MDALTRCRTSQRRYRNTLVFSAPDETALATAREVVRKALAWKSIEKEADKGELRKQLTQGQIDNVKDRAKTSGDAAEKAIRAAWTHILYAEKDEGALDGRPFEIAQTTLLSRERPSIAASAYEKLSSRGDSIIKDTLGPRMLMAKLSGLWPEHSNHLPIADLKEWFASYVYLPKLRDSAVLESAIAEGVSTSDPLFGYADRYDEAAGRYEGLVFGKLAPTAFAPTAIIVRKEIAAEASRPSGENGAVITGPTDPSAPGDPGSGGVEPAIPPTDLKPRRFFGTVEINTVRPIKSFETIVNAVVAELQRRPGAKITLTLDIQATHDEGFDENDVGVIRDNTRQLKFRADSTGFEE